MEVESIRPGAVIYGPLLPEPVEVIAVIPIGSSIKVIGKGLNSKLVREPVLNAAQMAQLTMSPVREPFDGDPAHFRLGIEAMRLGLAYEYDPFFSLSIARVDPLPHQLEAVYDYFLKLPRIRFLLADDPGAGKTIMAGLLLKELNARGLVKRRLNVWHDWNLKLGMKANPPPEPTGKLVRPKRGKPGNLVDRLREHKGAVLAFMGDSAVPFDNNQAERDLRMMKVRETITGCFRTVSGAERFCRIRGYFSTMRKQGILVDDSLRQAISGAPIVPATT